MTKVTPTQVRKASKWKRGLVEWMDGDVANLSVVFSWQMEKACQRAKQLVSKGYQVYAGGPAVSFNPSAISDVALVGQKANALPYHNPNAVFTTRGCSRDCPFCIVHKIEGDLVELDDWKSLPIVCDNNLLGASKKHFDRVIDKFKAVGTRGIDFNQGLDARFLTKHHAERFTEIDFKCIRLAWDFTSMECQFMQAFEILRSAGIPSRKIRAYVLIGFNDTPEDALYRLRTIKELGSWPNPMRYQPIDTPKKNSYVAPGWTDEELKRYMRYWANLRYTAKIPFEEFDNKYRSKPRLGR